MLAAPVFYGLSMNCKGCGKTILEEEQRKVADWYFCPECFQKLMDRSDTDGVQETSETLTSQAEAGSPSESSSGPSQGSFADHTAAKNICDICQADLGDEGGQKLGIWSLCDTCYEDMTAKAKPDAPESEALETNAGDLPDETDEGQDAAPVDRNKTIYCHFCNRLILAVAAKEADGEYLCPDCFYKKSS